MNLKSKYNKSGWVMGRWGIKREASKENGKGTVTIPWSFLNKTSTDVVGLNRVTSEKHNVDVYVLEKTLSGDRIRGVFDSQRDALKHYDKALLARGREPKFIFKRT